MAKMIRVNTSVSTTMNDWLNKQSEETGIPKSTIVMLALENYYQQKEVMKSMSDMGAIMAKLEEIENRIEK
ncbi:hypothetical protein [Nocardia sp. NPDC019309]|uniref:hypothetical protein n=1 Tax=Nocardia sp. NPDC019309 TaxID=3154785 RepID=UPI003405E610|nr:hypothetical protein [Escherichia coli]